MCGISGILGEQIALDTNLMEEDFSKVEEQFTMARVYANKTKTIVESLTQEQKKQTGTVLFVRVYANKQTGTAMASFH